MQQDKKQQLDKRRQKERYVKLTTFGERDKEDESGGVA